MLTYQPYVLRCKGRRILWNTEWAFQLGWELGINYSVDDLCACPASVRLQTVYPNEKVKEWHVKMRKKYDEEYEDSEDDEDDEEQGGGGAGDIEMKVTIGYTNVKRWLIKKY